MHYFQFISNFDPLKLQVVSCEGRVLLAVTCVQKLQDIRNPGYYAYECAISYATLPDGCYTVQIITANTIEYVSELIQVAETFENTLLFSYFHSRFHEDVIFETFIKFLFRVEGSFGRLIPKNVSQYYEDQKMNNTLLSSKPYTAFSLSLGGSRGVPDWVIEKLNYIWSCNNVLIDGVSYSQQSAAELEVKHEENYPLSAINMEVRYGINRGSKFFSPEINQNARRGVVYNIDTSRMFGQFPNGSNNIISITGTE